MGTTARKIYIVGEVLRNCFIISLLVDTLGLTMFLGALFKKLQEKLFMLKIKFNTVFNMFNYVLSDIIQQTFIYQ